MIYPIVKFGHLVLEAPAAEVTSFDDGLKKLIEDMFESMYAARGVGRWSPADRHFETNRRRGCDL